MFDIGFWELALIGVVALLVVGPDRLPGLARTVGLWVGRIRRYVGTGRDDIEREIQADELKKMLEKSNDLNPLQDIVDETTNTIGVAKQEITDVEKGAQGLMSEESSASASASEVATGVDDETGAEPITPDTAATAVGEAMSARGNAPAPAPTEASEQAVENTEDDEQRTR
jgi:sec-independent protein translocase protein TatB